MSRTICTIILFFFVLLCQAQQGKYNFHHIDASSGLADGVVRAIGQDKYGYVWISTLSGLNRFDGYSVKTFYNDPSDPTSLPLPLVRSIFCDRNGNLWLGCNEGLVQFEYATSRFLPVAGTKGLGIFKMVQHTSGDMYLQTNKGLVYFDPAKKRVTVLAGIKNESTDFVKHFHDMFLYGNELYLSGENGVTVYNCIRKTASWMYMSAHANVKKIARDRFGNIWMLRDEQTEIIKSNPGFTHFQHFRQSVQASTLISGGSFFDLLVDQNGVLWTSTNINGLAKFNHQKNEFEYYRHNPMDPTSLASSLTNFLFQGKRGFIWVGTEGNGIDYFHPAKNLFAPVDLPDDLIYKYSLYWARSTTTDMQKNHWYGYGGMLIKQDAKTKALSTFYNDKTKSQLHSGSVRSIMADRENNIWIGTAAGMNCFTAKGEMQFLDEKDSLPQSFMWKVFQDSKGIIWVGNRDNIFYRDTIDKKFHSINVHPVLKVHANLGARAVFEDSKKRMWFGGNGGGLICYDPSTGVTKRWFKKDAADTSFLGNVVNSIAEDKNGVIWFSGFRGLTAYNPATDQFKRYTARDGLPSVKLSGLMVDNRNNLWMGSTRGLLVFDSSRTNIRMFDQNDGLPTMEFSDMDAYKTSEGEFIYPTIKGFIKVNPNLYVENSRPPEVFLSTIQISGQNAPLQHAEDLNHLQLKWNQNFFSFQLTAFNYNNPKQTWYAYQLEGFDKEWVYTQNRQVNYTNVPGGKYVFRYKATDDPNNWKVKEKTLYIEIDTVFYKAVWFWCLIILLVALVTYWYYKARLVQQRRIFNLQTKAQELEKEKALVMYESLKQQLNPHFLFNSLTSLSSLIKIDPKLAGKFLNGMSNIYRYILKSRDNEVVSLAEELKFVDHYIQLQKTRFGPGLEISIDIPEEHHHKKIAPVTLQNLIENAIKHNIIDDESPLSIQLFEAQNYLIVRNNLQRKNHVDTSNKQGLVNLNSLYRYLTKAPIVIETDDQFYTIKIPLI